MALVSLSRIPSARQRERFFAKLYQFNYEQHLKLGAIIQYSNLRS